MKDSIIIDSSCEKEAKCNNVYLGTHILADFYLKDSTKLKKVENLKIVLNDAVKFAGLTKVGEHYVQFEPEGCSGIVVLAESHISIHTWPEYNLASIDIYTCGNPQKAELAYEYLKEVYKPINIKLIKTKRPL